MAAVAAMVVGARAGAGRVAAGVEVASVGTGRNAARTEAAGAAAEGDRQRLPEVDPFTLRAAQRGDRRAFDAIVDLYDDRLRRLAYQLLHDADLTDDALQDVFFNAYRGLNGFRGRAALSTWLYRITYTVCMGYRRRRRPQELNLEDAEAAPDGGDGEDRLAIRDQVARALSRLTPDQRVVVLLVDGDGFDYSSAGEVLGVPKGTVCSRLNTARAAMRAALASQGAGPSVIAAGGATDNTEEPR